MEQAKKIIEDIVKKSKYTKDNAEVSFTDFADSSLNFTIVYWIKDLDNILQAQNEINLEIKSQFEKAKINFAYPSRTVYLKK
jgi:MscS family membrane protein